MMSKFMNSIAICSAACLIQLNYNIKTQTAAFCYGLCFTIGY